MRHIEIIKKWINANEKTAQWINNHPDESKKLYNEFLSLCKIADDGGMHAIWTGEHHCMDFTIVWILGTFSVAMKINMSCSI